MTEIVFKCAVTLFLAAALVGLCAGLFGQRSRKRLLRICLIGIVSAVAALPALVIIGMWTQESMN